MNIVIFVKGIKMSELEEQLDYLKKSLNDTLDNTKTEWKKLNKHTEQLKQLESVDDIQMGGVKMSELTKGVESMSKFLEGSFNEIFKSMGDITDSLDNQKEDIKKG